MTRTGILSTTVLAGLTCLALRPGAAQPTTTGEMQTRQGTQTSAGTARDSTTTTTTTSRTTPEATSYDTTNDTSTINSSDTSSGRARLPRTASDVPTIALLGLAAVGGALALRKRSDTA